MENRRITLDEAAGLSYLSKDKITFSLNGEFPAACVYEGEEKTEYDRVWLHRVFPFDLAEEFISVQTGDNEELGIIRRLDDFDEATVKSSEKILKENISHLR
ncbi:MAG: DUF1854 domain-containing protein [Clostridia bacterium]|nr:DUF1854 domain-containing protein [Clostridia bacterium]